MMQTRAAGRKQCRRRLRPTWVTFCFIDCHCRYSITLSASSRSGCVLYHQAPGRQVHRQDNRNLSPPQELREEVSVLADFDRLLEERLEFWGCPRPPTPPCLSCQS